MKKLFFAAATVAAVFSFSNANAKEINPVEIHNYFMDGEIKEIKHDMLLTGNRWVVKNRNHKQMWYAVGKNDKDVVVKLKGNDRKEFVKVKGDGEKGFIKDIDPVKRDKHVVKILKEGKRHRAKDVVRENGTEIIRVK